MQHSNTINTRLQFIVSVHIVQNSFGVFTQSARKLSLKKFKHTKYTVDSLSALTLSANAKQNMVALFYNQIFSLGRSLQLYFKLTQYFHLILALILHHTIDCVETSTKSARNQVKSNSEIKFNMKT